MLLACACASLPTGYERQESAALTDTTETALGLRSAAVLMQHPGKSRLIPLVDGVDAFYARLAMATLAERSLDIQYFLWQKDVTGQVLLKKVLDAADRGVRVRLLLDDLNNQALDPELYVLDTHPNISVRLFNPFVTRGFKYVDFFTDPARINRRMHNKSMTADNQYTIVGGRNIGDEYFDAMVESNFYDMDVLAAGPVVRDVSRAFDVYWNHETAVPIDAFDHNTATAEDLEATRRALASFRDSQLDSRYADDLRASELADALAGGKYEYPGFVGSAEVVYDDPDKGLGVPPGEITTMSDLLEPYFEGADHEILLISPYFVPGDGGVAWLRSLISRGVVVDVITNSYGSTDSISVHAGYSRYRESLLSGDVNIFEVKPDSRRERREGSVAFDSEASLHTKAFVLDRKTVFIGSLNLDPRSVDINTEMGIVIHSPEMATHMASDLDDGKKEHVYQLRLVRSPPESRGEFTVYTWDIVWDEQVRGETVRHTDEPRVGLWERIKLFFAGLLPESQI